MLCLSAGALPEDWMECLWMEAARLMAGVIERHQHALPDEGLTKLIGVGGLLVRQSVLCEQAGKSAATLLAKMTIGGGK
jgi:hypothetical protein